MAPEKNLDRYKKINGNIIIEVAVKNSRQLFNERDPAPFRERDLDDKFVTYLLSSIEEFPLPISMKIHILTAEEEDLREEKKTIIREAIRSYFQYEAQLAGSKLRRKLRTARFFAIIGFSSLFLCLSISQVINRLAINAALADIFSVGFVIIGWVALWHPIEALLYDWWPIHEQRKYFEKISKLEVEIGNLPSS